LSSSNPNMQQIPKTRDANIRSIFRSRWKDGLIMTVDYDQAELRMLAELSGDKNLRRVFARGQDIHAATAADIFGKKLSSVTPDERAAGKTINFAIIFGAGAKLVAAKTGMGVREAATLVRRWFKVFPGAAEWKAAIEDEGVDVGWIDNLFGRRRRIIISDPQEQGAYRALRQFVNFPIQSGVYDLVMTSLVAVGEKLHQSSMRSRLLLQIHDELMLETHPKEVDDVAHLVRETMLHPPLEQMFGIELEVPLGVDVKVGPNWRDQESYFE
jgi:DNA polymerase-1